MADSRPNIIMIFPDQWRGDCLSLLDHPVVETPFIDQIGYQGSTFTSAYSPCPSCIATRACLLTGLNPHHCGRLGYRDRVAWPYPHLATTILRDHGYQTLCAGKTHFYPARARLGFEELQLFEMPWQDPEHPSDYHLWLQRETHGAIRSSSEVHDSNSWFCRPWPHGEHLHATTWTFSAAIELLDRRDPTRPFFLQVSPHRPHPPIDPPQAWFDRFRDVPLPPVPIGDWAADFDTPVEAIAPGHGHLSDRQLDRARRGYYAQLAHIDFQVGRLWRYLVGRKLLENTWLIFVSDHGEQLGDHHNFRKIKPFEGSAKVPLLIRPPAGVDAPRGHRCAAPVAHDDLAATILDMAGLAFPEPVDGRSMLPLVRGESPATWRPYVHGEHAPGWQFVTDGKRKFAWESTTNRQWFFDLEADPRELHNLIDVPAHAAAVAQWRQYLIEELAARPEDGLSDGHELIPGRTAPAVRDWLLAMEP